MKVVFLDIDGVLTLSVTGYQFDTDCIERLRSLVKETGATVVLCSSWKDETLAKTLLGLPPRLVEVVSGQTPNIPGCIKGEEIEAWLEGNPVESWIAVDDRPVEYLPGQQDRIVVTDRKTGLTELKKTEAVCLLKYDI